MAACLVGAATLLLSTLVVLADDCPTTGISDFEQGSFTATFDTYCGYNIPNVNEDADTQVAATSFAQCQALCVQSHPLCYAFAYEASGDHSSQNCYLKHYAVTSAEAEMWFFPIDAAILDLDSVQAVDDCSSISPRKVTDRSTYNIICGYDILGSDLPPVPALSLSNCLDLCDNNHECEAVAYQASQQNGLYNCYLKSAGYSDPISNTYGVAAATRAPVVSSSTSTSSSTSATTTSSSVSTTPTTSTSTSTSNNAGLSTNAKAAIGGVLGGLAALAAVAGIWWYVTRRSRHRSEPSEPPEMADASQTPFTEPFLPRHGRVQGVELESPGVGRSNGWQGSSGSSQSALGGRGSGSHRWTGSTQLS